MLAFTLKILLNYMNIFIMKYYVKYLTPFLEQNQILCFSEANKG